MKNLFLVKTLALSAAVVLCFTAVCLAATESKVSRASILAVEAAINKQFSVNLTDPYDLLSTSHGTYLEGYGTAFTFEIQLVTVAPPNPFRPIISPQEVMQIHDRKVKRIPVMEDAMRTLMGNASRTLEGLPPEEHIAMEAALFAFNWENSRDLPKRIFMSATKQQLLDAMARHADLSTVIEKQDR